MYLPTRTYDIVRYKYILRSKNIVQRNVTIILRRIGECSNASVSTFIFQPVILIREVVKRFCISIVRILDDSNSIVGY